MAVRQFALQLDEYSLQTGEISFKELVDEDEPVVFELSNAIDSADTEFDLITKKGGVLLSHKFQPLFSGGRARVTLSVNDMQAVYADAYEGDLDYIEARWTVGQTDTPITSLMFMIQSNKPYDLSGWPAITS